MKFLKISCDRPLIFSRLSIRAKLFSLVMLPVFALLFSGFYLQTVLNENAHVIMQQSDFIHIGRDRSDAYVQFNHFRWAYLTYLDQPGLQTAKEVLDSFQAFKESEEKIITLPPESGIGELEESVSSLQTLVDSLTGHNIAVSKKEALAKEAFVMLERTDAALIYTRDYLVEQLDKKSKQIVKKTGSMRAIPIIFILLGLLAVFLALTVIFIDILAPMNRITGAMAAASTDTENSRKYILPVSRNDEIGKITLTLNHLLEEVSLGVDKIRQTENMLNHAQRMEIIGRMSGGIAHDFNNMLIVISGNLELIERRIGNNQELRGMIESALSAVQKGKDLTQRILVFSRKQILKPETININKQIPDIMELIRRAVREDVDVETDLAKDLCDINADPAQFENAILNLAINARDAIQGNDGKIVIRTKNITINGEDNPSYPSLGSGSYAMISVQDNGAGISPDIIDRIFDPFFTTKEPGKGTGLGLSMVYGFTRQSGGDVFIKSMPGQGTTISLFFPQSFLPAQKNTREYTRRDLFPEHIKGGRESLMVVEDREDVLKFLSTTLRELGYRVTTATDGLSALRRLKSRRNLDMLVTDIVMPGPMNGEDLAAEIRKQFPDTKILYISGYTRDALINQGALKAGVHLLAKPFTTADLAREVRNILEG